MLHGNAYVEILPGADGAPAELYALRPDRIAVEADVHGWPMAFVYRIGGVSTRLAAERVIHIRNMHPLDDHYGLGCLGAASGAVAIHNAADRWNKALLDNAARPSGALVYEAGEGNALSGEQYDRLKAELTESFQGAGNAGRPMLLEGGLSWQAMSLSPADMDFAGMKSAAAREIALAFGVPPMLLGLPGDATYANYREANKAVWRQAILPMAGKILAALAEGLRDAYPGLTLGIDLDQIAALSEDRERLWAQVSAADFLSDEEKRTMLGIMPAAMTEDITMSGPDMLTQLTVQAEARGTDIATLRALVEEASQLGAQRALQQLGLNDPHAAKDMADLRELLSAWRDAKSTAFKAVVDWAVKIGLAVLLIGLAFRFNLTYLVQE